MLPSLARLSTLALWGEMGETDVGLDDLPRDLKTVVWERSEHDHPDEDELAVTVQYTLRRLKSRPSRPWVVDVALSGRRFVDADADRKAMAEALKMHLDHHRASRDTQVGSEVRDVQFPSTRIRVDALTSLTADGDDDFLDAVAQVAIRTFADATNRRVVQYMRPQINATRGLFLLTPKSATELLVEPKR